MGEPLAPGYLRTELVAASETDPVRVHVAAGFRWTSGDQLRAASVLLATVADRLDAAIADDGSQLRLIEEAS